MTDQSPADPIAPPAQTSIPPDSAAVTKSRRRTVGLTLTLVLIGLLFWALYFSIGSSLESRHLFRNDLFFNSDTARIARDIGVFDAPHKRSNVHPLFILFMTPPGTALAHLTGSPTKGPLVLNSFLGGVSIALAGAFLLGAGLPVRRALLFTLILGCSAAHLFFGSLPETFTLSGISIMVLFLLVLKRPGRFFPFLAAGIFSFGVLLTNAGPAALAYATSFVSLKPARREWEYIFYRVLLFCICLLVVTAGLARLQKQVWPTTRPFYLVQTFGYEKRFMDPLDSVSAVAARERLLARHVFAYDWFAPNLLWDTARKVRMQTEALSTIEGAGRLAVAIWFVLLVASGYFFLRYRLYREAVPLALVICLLFNLALHTKYGDDLFLYSCNTCFLILSLIALCTNALRLNGWKATLLDVTLLLLLALEVANNQLFVRRILSIHTDSVLF